MHQYYSLSYLFISAFNFYRLCSEWVVPMDEKSRNNVTEFNQNWINYTFEFETFTSCHRFCYIVILSHCSHWPYWPMLHVSLCPFRLVIQTITATNKTVPAATNNNIAIIFHCTNNSLLCKLLSVIETMSIYVLNYSNCHRSKFNYRAFMRCLA